MIAEELLSDEVTALRPSDSVQDALARMERFYLQHLPVVDNARYEGLVSEDMLLEQEEGRTIEHLPLIDRVVYVKTYHHLYEVLRVGLDNAVSVIPVVDDDDQYAGVVALNQLTDALAENFAVRFPGGIVVLSIRQRDYSLAEISRLIEAEDVKVLGVSVAQDPTDEDKLRLTVKMNRTDLSRVVATLERFGYHIAAQHHESPIRDNTQDRLEGLLRYLNI